MKIEFNMKMLNEKDWVIYARKNIGQILTLYSKNVQMGIHERKDGLVYTKKSPSRQNSRRN